MAQRLNREIKAYCPDFSPARQLLQDLGAIFIEVKTQVYSYYHLPAGGDSEGTRRFKLRVEKGKGELVYYQERQENGARTSRFQTWETDDPRIGEVLDAALGTRAVVRKQRELWTRENVLFNLDTVEGVGQVLEVEVKEQEGCDIDAQVSEYRRLLGPCLGPDIHGSNEDPVAGVPR